MRRLKTGILWCAVWTCGAVLCGAATLTGCASRSATETAATPRPLTDAEKAQRDEQARKAAIGMRAAQINRSNLPPEEKQRLLNQVQASGGQ
jgi:hypothetical protein